MIHQSKLVLVRVWFAAHLVLCLVNLDRSIVKVAFERVWTTFERSSPFEICSHVGE